MVCFQEAPYTLSCFPQTLGFCFNYLILEVPKGVQPQTGCVLGSCCARVRPGSSLQLPQGQIPTEGNWRKDCRPQPLPHLSSGSELTHTHSQNYPQGPTPSWPSAYLNVLGHTVLKDSLSVHSRAQSHPAQHSDRDLLHDTTQWPAQKPRV